MSPPNGNVILSPLADWEGDRVDTAGTATSADTPGNKIELIALDRNEFYLWKDMAAQEKYQSGTNYYDAGILYLAGDKSERYIDGIWRRYLIEQKKGGRRSERPRSAEVSLSARRCGWRKAKERACSHSRQCG
jgi:hypothetical protein